MGPKTTSKRDFIPLALHSAPASIEGRPASLIAQDCFQKNSYKSPFAGASITQNSLIESFQNGLSKGFLNGLRIAQMYLEQHNTELAISFASFVKESENEQLKEQSPKRTA